MRRPVLSSGMPEQDESPAPAAPPRSHAKGGHICENLPHHCALEFLRRLHNRPGFAQVIRPTGRTRREMRFAEYASGSACAVEPGDFG